MRLMNIKTKDWLCQNWLLLAWFYLPQFSKTCGYFWKLWIFFRMEKTWFFSNVIIKHIHNLQEMFLQPICIISKEMHLLKRDGFHNKFLQFVEKIEDEMGKSIGEQTFASRRFFYTLI